MTAPAPPRNADVAGHLGVVDAERQRRAAQPGLAEKVTALKQFLVGPSSNQLVTAANALGAQALNLSAVMNPILANANSTVAPIFASLAANGTMSVILAHS